MADPATTTSVSHPAPGVGVIGIAGRFTGQSEAALMDAYGQAAEGGAASIVLDLTDLAYMNSSGIGLLVTLLIRTRRARQRLVACGLTDHYREIFQLTRLDEAIAIYDDLPAAVAAAIAGATGGST